MRELAKAFLAQGKTVRAAALMLNLIKTEPTPENLELAGGHLHAAGIVR